MAQAEIDIARNAFIVASTKDAVALPNYCTEIGKAISPDFAVIVKQVKAKDRTEAQAEIAKAVAQERAAFVDGFIANYTGKGTAKEIARVYWNRVINHGLPKKEAGATDEKDLDLHALETMGKLIRRFHRQDEVSDEALAGNALLEQAYMAWGGDLVALKKDL